VNEQSFDVVVVGAGPAGEVAAGRLADAGLEVAVVESRLIGGECSFYACMPSKGLLRPGELLAEVRRIPGVREIAENEVYASAALKRRDEIIHNLDDSSMLPWLEDKGIELFRGHARFEGERRLSVGNELLEARRAVIVSTGSSASVPPIDGLAEAKPWTNREATTSKEVPERLLVLGGGVVAAEMAQAWSTLGSSVSLVERGPRLIAREEEFASELVAEGLRERGVDIRLGVTATGVSAGDRQVQLELDSGETLRGNELLVAVGRKPNTSEMGLEQIGLEPGKSIEVDDQLRANDWLFAVGDVNGRVLLTHMGKYQARVASDVILGNDARITEDGARSPQVIFTDPQVASVGYSLAAAKEAGIDATAIDLSTQETAGGSFFGGESPAQTRFVVDEGRGVLAGATFVGPDISEFLHAATIAVVGAVPLERLAHAVPSFPTRSEVWLNFLEAASPPRKQPARPAAQRRC
jgi:pyruvate/2-oxoglutarate dehydrogenase complex dihydrolipoamide dehydrogenase (E3) component